MKVSPVSIVCLSVISLLVPLPEIITIANASHEVSASPIGGTYDEPQVVTLISSNSSSLIYYTLDGIEPTLASTEYNGTQIIIASNTTLKFFAFIPLDNHTSPVITEHYVIIFSQPKVESTEPASDARRVGGGATINVTFSTDMDESSISDSSFLISSDSLEDPVTGTISYDQITKTASYEPDVRLDPGIVYEVVLTGDIRDTDGNPLEAYSWSFTTGGQLEIQVRDVETFDPISGSAFTITPDPFQLEESRAVDDNGPSDSDSLYFGASVDGLILLDNIENNFTTYIVSETTVPHNYSRIYGDVIVSITQKNHCVLCGSRGFVLIQNINSSSSISDVEGTIEVPRPYLNRSQFELYEDNAITGIFSGIQGQILETEGPVQSPNSGELPPAVLSSNDETLNSLNEVESLNFLSSASENLLGAEIIELFDIPTYPGPDSSIASKVLYIVPAVVIPYDDSANNFVLTPIIDEVPSGLQLFVKQASFVETNVAKIESINMTISRDGNDVGFIFGISDKPPVGTPEPPLEAPALFLDIGFVGDIDFSEPSAFQSSPKIDILVNKTLPNFPELPNGCPDFRLLFFNGTGWEEVQKLDPTGNFTEFCPFTLEPEHFSKFAVGGVKGQTISTEDPPSQNQEENESDDRNRGRSGGGKRTTVVTQPNVGKDIETTIRTESGTVILEFESLDEDSSQLKINSNELASYEEFFDEIAFLQDDNEHGIIKLDNTTYATSGEVFDIDASALRFAGAVYATIPYDEDAVLISGLESSVKFLHYNDVEQRWEDKTTSVDENANTVTGLLDSLSPVVSAIILESGSEGRELMEDPSSRMDVSLPDFEFSDYSKIILSTNIRNISMQDQNYVIVIQVVDEGMVVQHIDWRLATLEANNSLPISMVWNATNPGVYTVQLFLLTDLDNPWLLAEPLSSRLEIS